MVVSIRVFGGLPGSRLGTSVLPKSLPFISSGLKVQRIPTLGGPSGPTVTKARCQAYFAARSKMRTEEKDEVVDTHAGAENFQ